MKKVLLGAIVGAIAFGAAATANAGFNATDIRPYVGVDYKYMEGLADGELKDVVKDNANLLGLTAGVQFNDYIGLEVSYAQSIKNLAKKTVETVDVGDGEVVQQVDVGFTDIDIEHFTAGVTGQYPLSENIYAKALIGASWQKMDATVQATATDPLTGETVTASASASDSKNGVFLGKVGLGYQMNKNSVVEVNYTREDDLNGVGLQYKYVF